MLGGLDRHAGCWWRGPGPGWCKHLEVQFNFIVKHENIIHLDPKNLRWMSGKWYTNFLRFTIFPPFCAPSPLQNLECFTFLGLIGQSLDLGVFLCVFFYHAELNSEMKSEIIISRL